MIVFTLRTTNTPEEYDKSANALLSVYPEMQIIDAGDKSVLHNGNTDLLRFQLISEKWLEDDGLYLDMDCVAKKRIVESDFDAPAFPNLPGGVLDYWAFFKPKGQHAFFADIVKQTNWNVLYHTQILINSSLRSKCTILYGYPSFEFLTHTYFSQRGHK